MYTAYHVKTVTTFTSIKELAGRWAPAVRDGLVKENRHEALADIRESIAELRHYRSFMGELGGL